MCHYLDFGKKFPPSENATKAEVPIDGPRPPSNGVSLLITGLQLQVYILSLFAYLHNDQNSSHLNCTVSGSLRASRIYGIGLWDSWCHHCVLLEKRYLVETYELQGPSVSVRLDAYAMLVEAQLEPITSALEMLVAAFGSHRPRIKTTDLEILPKPLRLFSSEMIFLEVSSNQKRTSYVLPTPTLAARQEAAGSLQVEPVSPLAADGQPNLRKPAEAECDRARPIRNQPGRT
ncbi:hypothetical protein PGTUg99_030226 [Puccinia graminis f. sp. tritici]|uniref:Uncharacterized protein n=1 Tax=Puccinia graminis f. sp. tritici TaxID=56615 RepID=A0A5B0NKR9_PUCGR|nr:hypothetical protein PGTUg99_030226 [Puccinia graminis f. sp. tritici]